MLKTKWEFITTMSLLVVLMTGRLAYAADDFFWSDVEPILNCYESRDGSAAEMGIVVDDKRVSQAIPSCEDAKKNRVVVLLNGKYLNTVAGTGADPFIENGRSMIPLRALADGFGFEVNWDQSDKKIILNKNDKSILMQVGKSEMLVDGEKVNLENAVPMVKNGVTFLPVRQLAEILDVKVDWNNTTRTAKFTEK
ncbi:copper amine oxidase N-terminal domain-containing protein [Paenibacillus lentus]|uniref:copper amine oxidase N-terminal domain-containing protein n=1 Tax=Paenibacillus lentus TaxID=1338368 RepID=UPI00366544C1